MEIRNISEEEYKSFINQEKPISFLQNYEWGGVERGLNKDKGNKGD